jgi:hypothetical protein
MFPPDESSVLPKIVAVIPESSHFMQEVRHFWAAMIICRSIAVITGGWKSGEEGTGLGNLPLCATKLPDTVP